MLRFSLAAQLVEQTIEAALGLDLVGELAASYPHDRLLNAGISAQDVGQLLRHDVTNRLDVHSSLHRLMAVQSACKNPVRCFGLSSRRPNT